MARFQAYGTKNVFLITQYIVVLLLRTRKNRVDVMLFKSYM